MQKTAVRTEPVEVFSIIKSNVKTLTILLATILITACSAPMAPEFSGSWAPVNQFDNDIKVIPKTRPYVYGAIKLDTTLSTMLERWAQDSKVAYTHTCDSDYTLPNSITSIKTTTMDEAIKLVNEIYAKQGVTVSFTKMGKLNLSCILTK
jgi:hypothetical protein